MTIPNGKGFFAWQIKAISGGDMQQIAAEAWLLGLAHASVKVANGGNSYNLRLGLFDDYIPALQAALAPIGVESTGWVYVYGDNPAGEARKAIERAKKFNLKSLIVDAEAEDKQAGQGSAAGGYTKALRAGGP